MYLSDRELNTLKWALKLNIEKEAKSIELLEKSELDHTKLLDKMKSNLEEMNWLYEKLDNEYLYGGRK